MIFHPAALLLAWGGLALALQWAGPFASLGMALLGLAVAQRYAPQRSRNLLRRSRWLLLSLFVLFLFFTPGEYFEGPFGTLGMTREGLTHGGEQLGRLLALLMSLALLHEHIGTQGLLVGFHWLLGPFAWRDATVVRLMLVFEYVDHHPGGNWREWLSASCDEGSTSEMLALRRQPLQAQDWALLLMVGVLLWVLQA